MYHHKSDDGVNQRKRTSPKTKAQPNFQYSSCQHRNRNLQPTQSLYKKPILLTFNDDVLHHQNYTKGNRIRGKCYNWYRNYITKLFTCRNRLLFLIILLGLVLSFIFIIFLFVGSGGSQRRSKGKIRNHPLVIKCLFSSEDGNIIKTKRIPINDEDRYPSKRQVDWSSQEEEMENSLRNSNKYNRARAVEINENEHCSLPYKWQSTSYPTCNSIHENDLTSFFNEGKKRIEERLLLLDHGFFRDIWAFKAGFDRNTTILKTLRHVHDLTDRNFNRHRRDALVMERLTSSNHVAQIYSYCGNSIFAEYATKGTISDIIWPLSGSNCTLSSMERIQLALKVAQAVSDVHMYDVNGTATIAHTDITPSQFLVFDDGTVKLNDFNRCRFLLHDNKGKICKYKVSHNPGKFRSPEEYSYLDQNEMVDIYAMGNIFYSILTEKWPFEDIDNVKVAQQKVQNGERPAMPSYAHDEVLQSLAEVVQLCWKQEFVDRPIAREVVSLLEQRIKQLQL